MGTPARGLYGFRGLVERGAGRVHRAVRTPRFAVAAQAVAHAAEAGRRLPAGCAQKPIADTASGPEVLLVVARVHGKRQTCAVANRTRRPRVVRWRVRSSRATIQAHEPQASAARHFRTRLFDRAEPAAFPRDLWRRLTTAQSVRLASRGVGRAKAKLKHAGGRRQSSVGRHCPPDGKTVAPTGSASN